MWTVCLLTAGGSTCNINSATSTHSTPNLFLHFCFISFHTKFIRLFWNNHISNFLIFLSFCFNDYLVMKLKESLVSIKSVCFFPCRYPLQNTLQQTCSFMHAPFKFFFYPLFKNHSSTAVMKPVLKQVCLKIKISTKKVV
jgi:hypothetical protein